MLLIIPPTVPATPLRDTPNISNIWSTLSDNGILRQQSTENVTCTLTASITPLSGFFISGYDTAVGKHPINSTTPEKLTSLTICWMFDGKLLIKLLVMVPGLTDKLLFKSGSYDVTDRAKEVLGKVATVLKNQPNIEFMVEGHTDNVPFKGNASLVDNWDLSVKRSTTIVRILQQQYGMNPANMTAAGRSEYKPVADNATADGKAANRRTRIVILPQLDQFFKLLEAK